MTTTTISDPHTDTAMAPEATVPVEPMLSMFDPVYLGRDEYGGAVNVPLIYRNMLIGGEPGGGKSTLLSGIIAHAALAYDCRLCLFDGKQVEFGLWRDVADVFVGPDIQHAIDTLRRLQQVMDNRYRWLLSRQERKLTAAHDLSVILAAVDEVAYFSTVAGDQRLQEQFVTLLRDLVARGRAVAVIVVAATQRPSYDIIPTSLRDLFSWRAATRCTTEASSDVVLGRGWAEAGYNAAHITPEDLGVCLLLAEGGIPRLIRGAWLSDADIIRVARYAAWTRAGYHPTTTEPHSDLSATRNGRKPRPYPTRKDLDR